MYLPDSPCAYLLVHPSVCLGIYLPTCLDRPGRGWAVSHHVGPEYTALRCGTLHCGACTNPERADLTRPDQRRCPQSVRSHRTCVAVAWRECRGGGGASGGASGYQIRA